MSERATKATLTKTQEALLRLLVKCEPGKGLHFDKGSAASLVAGALIRRGYVDRIEGGGLRVYRATDKGRDALAVYRERN